MDRNLLCMALLGALANMPIAHAQESHAALHADAMPATTLDGIVVVGVAPAMATTFVTDPKLPRQPVPASDGADYLKTIPGFATLRSGGTNGDPVLRGMFGSRINLMTNDGAMSGACPSRMDNALFMAAGPASPPERVLAALGPRMLRLAGERARGALPYFVPPEHTAFARETLGPDPLLAVEQAVVFETDPTVARERARLHTSIYTGLPNYTNNLRRFGFDDDDFVPGGSDLRCRELDVRELFAALDLHADRLPDCETRNPDGPVVLRVDRTLIHLADDVHDSQRPRGRAALIDPGHDHP